MSSSPAANAPPPQPKACPPFDAARFERQLFVDALSHWGIIALIVAGVSAGPFISSESLLAPVLLAAAVAGAWVAISSISMRIMQDLRSIPAMVEMQPRIAEERLAAHLKRWPLQKQVRLLIYHRLAILRHRQQRFGEAADICRHVLEHRLDPSNRVRTHLLLILVEADLANHNLAGAYAGLVEMGQSRLMLVESLQHMALQTRYELAVGQPGSVLANAGRKIAMAELMPAPQCGTMHAMFAAAAEQVGQTGLARWCRDRAELLGGERKAEKQENRKAENEDVAQTSF